jgi:muramoyltetrapeptide carboxypeptidase
MKKSSNIFIISPSSPFRESEQNIQEATKKLENLGFSVSFSPNCFSDCGNVSSGIQKRVDDIHTGFLDKSYDIIMSTQGGFNSNEILPFLDYKMIKNNPKVFCGMSDMTTLCTNLNQKSNIQTFYGLQFRHFVDSKNHNFEQFLEVIKNPKSFENTLKQQIKPNNIFRKGKLKGKLVGGNLAVLCWLAGTNYSLEVFEDSVLFLEDDEETNGHYWQMYLTHLKQTGIFGKIKGVIFGKVLAETKFEEKSKFEDILETVFEQYNFPILTDLNFGHTQLPLTIPYNTFIHINL